MSSIDVANMCMQNTYLKSIFTGINEQLCQIRKNWIFFMIAASLYSISYTSVSSSFHQYVTNPTISELNYSSALVSAIYIV